MSNHKALAIEGIEKSDMDVSRNWEAMTGELKSDMLALAQVHATLALAESADAQVAAIRAQTEQLRVANMIAWIVKLSSHPTDGGQLHPADIDDFDALIEPIRKGLGL
ncbi:hypothetical protein [Cryobacterium sp. Y62]|uniref:hypothetical protein n=1 Tax=Cryobacterium sp. Y62 TaxID=2048284 RepID=UPI000CE2B926|nr:hypothetical protein [Cryobacterium sp. Y62]